MNIFRNKSTRRQGYWSCVFPLISSILVSGCLSIGGGGAKPDPGGGAKTGFLTVAVGYGAVTNPPYECSGAGRLKLTPVALRGSEGVDQPQEKQYGYSGFSNTSRPPACNTGVPFPGLKTGTWQVTDVATGLQCEVNIVAGGSGTTVRIWNRVCQ